MDSIDFILARGQLNLLQSASIWCGFNDSELFSSGLTSGSSIHLVLGEFFLLWASSSFLVLVQGFLAWFESF